MSQDSAPIARLIADLDQWPRLDAAAQRALILRLAQRAADPRPSARQPSLDDAAVATVVRAYRQMDLANASRNVLPRLLAAEGTASALAAFADLIAAEPPGDPRAADLAFVPLFQADSYAAEALFPRLFDALAHPAVAALVLDTANHVFRRGLVERHPAADRSAQLIALLGALVGRLQRLAEAPQEFGRTPAEIRAVVADGSALVVGLCDALGLIGDAAAVGKLHQALSLGHRRLRTEAAAALARLGQSSGIDALVELTAEPVARNRALAYLDELGHADRVPPDRDTPVARAEGDFAAWLAQPEQFGMPPHAITLVDSCRQHWPGFDEPVDCYLFDFEFHLPQGELSGVGIAGPVTWCLPVDLEDLPPADIYAAYAGWHAEHELFSETEYDDLSADERAAFTPAAERLAEQGYRQITPARLGRFFDQTILVFTALHGDAACNLLVDREHVHVIPAGASRRPIGPAEAYAIFKGRKLLQAFNPSEAPAE
jgi:hypothetical protein